eukprot:GILJ01002101.1.p1 GENE.GILJ01002101.1~~GILJ01002101.1.p1  ORF type:complete len:550 (-),score=103.97 GILJ01002101.1:165-1568(-)
MVDLKTIITSAIEDKIQSTITSLGISFFTDWLGSIFDLSLSKQAAKMAGKILPNMVGMQSVISSGSLSGDSTAGAAGARSDADLLVHIFMTPSSSASVNKGLASEALALKTIVVSTYFAASANLGVGLKSLPSLSASASVASMGIIFDSIIEYTDSNNNGIFDSTESVASRYIFHEKSWSDASTSSTKPTEKSAVWHAQASTSDGVFTIRFKCASGPTLDKASNTLLSPNITKTDIAINKYPYAGTNTKLTLKTYVLVAGASASASVKVSVKGFETSTKTDTFTGETADNVLQFINGDAKTYLSWPTVLTTGSSTGSVSVSNVAAVSSSVAIGVLRDLTIKGAPKFYSANFNFQTEENHPNYILWDPSVGYGEPPVSGSDSTANVVGIAVGVIVAVAVVSIVVGVVMYRRKHPGWSCWFNRSASAKAPMLSKEQPRSKPPTASQMGVPRGNVASKVKKYELKAQQQV